MKNGKCRLRRIFFTLSLCLFILPPLHAGLPDERGLSQYVMTTWTDRDGLPSDTVLDVVQDKTGFIWLASYEGLVRFDGENFTLFDSSSGFTGKSARVLAIGNDGTLWIGTNTNGLYSYRDGAFSSWTDADGLPDLSIRSLAVDQDNTVWVGTANGIASLKDGVLTTVVQPGTSTFGIANFLLPLQDGSVVAGSNLPGLWLVTANGLIPFLEGQGVSRWSYSSAYVDAASRLWLGTSSGQIIAVSRNQVRELYELTEIKGASVNGFFPDGDGTLWIATDRGIFSKRGESFDSFSEINGLPSNVVSALCKDYEGNLWVGTERGGLAKFSPGKFVNTSRTNGLISDAVNAVTEDAYRSLWVATDDGVSFFPSETDPYATDDKRKTAVDSLVSSLSGIRVRQVRPERDGSLWFSTYSDFGLLVFRKDGTTATITRRDGLPINRVRFSFRASNGELWIGTTAGPVLFKRDQTITFTRESGLPNLFILGAMEDEDGSIWLGTDGGGLSRYDGTAFKTWSKKDGLAGNVVFRILKDRSNRLWISTSEGLSLFDRKTFWNLDGLIPGGGESVFEVLEDKAGKLWIISARRIIVVSSDDLADSAFTRFPLVNFRSYDRLDGLAGQLSANAWAYMNEFGIVYFPTLRGLSTYNPQSVIVNSLPPPVLVEQVLVDGNPVGSLENGFTVPASVRRLTFRFTALSYVIPQRVRFQYMLEGYDSNWISAGVQREIGYTNLSPGTYRFKVKAENNDGVINEEGAVVTFRKKPHVYQTIPFYVLIAFFFVSIGFLAAALRVRGLNRRSQELKRLVRVRTAEVEEEKERSDRLLMNILPVSVASELKSLGRSTPHTYPSSAVLFADLVGFTPWSASLEPEAIIRELNEIFTAFDDIVGKEGCERIKTLGDGYLAASGVPIADPDGALKLTRAAIEMLKYVERRKTEKKDNLEVRIGIDSGSIVGGVVGVRKYIFDIFGDPVNMAFRLQALSVPMGLTVSAPVGRMITRSLRLVERPALEVKGKGKIHTYFVVWRELSGVQTGTEQFTSLLEQGRSLLTGQKYAECVELLGNADYSILESEAGIEVFTILSHAYAALGRNDEAEEALKRARRYAE